MGSNRFTAAVVATAAAVVAAVGPACASTPNQDPVHPVALDRVLAEALRGVQAENVESYLARVREEIFVGTGSEKYGVMVCKATGGKGYTMNASAVAYHSIEYGGDLFGVWLIQPGSGTFTNHRAHAHHNWTFIGYRGYNPETRTVLF